MTLLKNIVIQEDSFKSLPESELVLLKCGVKLEGILHSYKYVKGNSGDLKLVFRFIREFNRN